MKNETLIVVLLACVTVLGVVIVSRGVSAQDPKKSDNPLVAVSHAVSAQGQAQEESQGQEQEETPEEARKKPPKPKPTPTVYNPYPPGILPPDIESEIARVLREVDFIEGRAIAEWHALPPPDTDRSAARPSEHRN